MKHAEKKSRCEEEGTVSIGGNDGGGATVAKVSVRSSDVSLSFSAEDREDNVVVWDLGISERERVEREEGRVDGVLSDGRERCWSGDPSPGDIVPLLAIGDPETTVSSKLLLMR